MTQKIRIGNRYFERKGHTYVMGILNVTPDSFSDGGKYNTMDKALYHVQEMVDAGADVLDIGGESTRPGYQMLSDEAEIDRVAQCISEIKRRWDIPISLDTYKANVAKAGIQAGADMINDIWGLQYDPAMVKVIAENDVAVCLMHNQKQPCGEDVMTDVCQGLQKSLSIAIQGGIAADKILLDPGIGFVKSPQQNLVVLHRLQQLHSLDFPLLLGVSKKSVIGLALDLPVGEREEGTLATTVWAVVNGVSFVRVHDVQANRRAIRMMECIQKEHI